jgi:hypothetical protein
LFHNKHPISTRRRSYAWKQKIWQWKLF